MSKDRSRKADYSMISAFTNIMLIMAMAIAAVACWLGIYYGLEVIVEWLR